MMEETWKKDLKEQLNYVMYIIDEKDEYVEHDFGKSKIDVLIGMLDKSALDLSKYQLQGVLGEKI